MVNIKIIGNDAAQVNGGKTMKTRYKLLAITLTILAIICGTLVYQEYWVKKTTISFTIAYQDRVADLATIIAAKLGYFEDEGLKNVRFMMFHSGPACAEAIIYGKADFGTMGDTTAIIATATKEPVIKIIASHGGGEHRHRIIARIGSGIKSLRDLVNKRIAIKKGTSTHGGLMLLEKAYDLNLEPYLIDMDPSDQLAALAAGSVDALVASEPTPSIAEVKGYGYQVTTLGGLNNTYPILFVVRREFAEKHPDIVIKVLRALIRGARFVREHPEKAATILAEITGIPEKAIRRAMNYHYYNVTLDEKVINSLKVMASFLKEIGKIKELPRFNEVIDRRFLLEAVKTS